MRRAAAASACHSITSSMSASGAQRTGAGRAEQFVVPAFSQAFRHERVLLLTTYLCGGAEKARNGSVNSGQVFLQSLQGFLFFFFPSSPSINT